MTVNLSSDKVVYP